MPRAATSRSPPSRSLFGAATIFFGIVPAAAVQPRPARRRVAHRDLLRLLAPGFAEAPGRREDQVEASAVGGTVIDPCTRRRRPSHLIARPSIDLDGMRAYLEDVGGAGWLERRLEEAEGAPNAGELLVEFGGRACYRSWEPGLNVERHARAQRPARVLREHPAQRARQRARARQLLVCAAQRLARLHPRAGPPPRRVGVQPGEPALRASDRHRLPRGRRRSSRCASGSLAIVEALEEFQRDAARDARASTTRASPSTSRRRSPRRCAASRRSASRPTSSGARTCGRCAT